MREEATGRHVQRVDALGLQPAADRDRLRQRVAAPVPGDERLVVINAADLDLEVEVRADLAPDRSHHLEQEPGPSRQRAAVGVAPVVDRRAQELREEVAVAGVQLDAVESGLPSAPGPGGVLLNHVGDLGRRHLPARQAVHGVWPIGAAEPRLSRVLDAGDVALTTAVAELQDELAVVLVHPLADGAPEGHLVVGVDVGVVGQDAAAYVDRCVGGDDRADPAPGEALFPVDPGRRPAAVVVVDAPGDAAAEHPVLDGEAAELQRCEDRIDRRIWVRCTGHGVHSVDLAMSDDSVRRPAASAPPRVDADEAITPRTMSS